MDNLFNILRGAKWFSMIDLKSGFWQVEMHANSNEKTTFCTSGGLWQFNVMPFGLCNVPATFERLIETILRDIIGKFCSVYMDDVIIFSKTPEEHIEHLQIVFHKLQEAGLKLSLKNYSMFKKEVGHIVSASGLKTDPKKVEAITQWPIPKDRTDVKSFLGPCLYYRQFVKGFANIVKPLNCLTEKEHPFE